MNWNYKGKEITSIEDFPKGAYGFIYEITHLPTGRKYVGKKALYFTRTKKFGKRKLEEIKTERKARGIGGRVPTKEKVTTESDWRTYYGSHVELKSLVRTHGEDDFRREIVRFVPTKKLLTYYETKELFIREVLENQEYFNDNILAKFYRKDLVDD